MGALPYIAGARDLLSNGCNPRYPKLRTDSSDKGQTMFGDEIVRDSSYVREIYGECHIWESLFQDAEIPLVYPQSQACGIEAQI